MMCLEARRLLLVEPESRDPELRQHLEQCPECAREAERAWRFEQTLRDALQAEPSPELESRILLARSVKGRNRGRRPYLAMAAGLLLAMGLSFWLGMNRNLMLGIPEALPQLVIHHIERELNHLDEDHDLPMRSVELLLAGFGSQFKGDLGHVRYASRCDIRKKAGLHMVLQGESGPVTVLIMPGEYLDQPSWEPVRSDRFKGVVAPTSYGSIAVVGERGEPVEPLLENLRQHLVWADRHPAI